MVVCVDSQSLIISEQEKKETYVTMAAGSYYPPAAPTYLSPRCTTNLYSPDPGSCIRSGKALAGDGGGDDGDARCRWRGEATATTTATT